jgi:hypothetical protein
MFSFLFLYALFDSVFIFPFIGHWTLSIGYWIFLHKINCFPHANGAGTETVPDGIEG